MVIIFLVMIDGKYFVLDIERLLFVLVITWEKVIRL